MTFADWYSSTSNRSVATLQAIVEASTDYDPMSSDPLLNKKVATFDFLGIVDYFDQAGNPSNWEVADALLDQHLASTDTEALGGDLSYQYGLNGSLAGLALTPVQNIMGSAQFGSSAQTLQPLPGLQEGLIKLS
jgi:hypothetical protein